MFGVHPDVVVDLSPDTTLVGVAGSFPGYLATKYGQVQLANGLNANVDTLGHSYLRIGGVTAAFDIAGLKAGANGPPADGQLLTILSATGQTMKLLNNSNSCPIAENRILTNSGADVSIAGVVPAASLVYDKPAARWILVSRN